MKKIIASLLLVGVLTSARASDVVAYKTQNMITGVVAVAASTTVSNICGTNFLTLRPGSGVSMFPLLAGTNVASCVSNTIITYQVCYDKTYTNWSTATNGLIGVTPLNGAVAQRGYQRFSEAQVGDATAIRVWSIQSLDTNVGGIFLSNVIGSHYFAP